MSRSPNQVRAGRVQLSEMSSFSAKGLLAEREHLVLLAIERLADRAYAVAIGDEIERRTGIRLRRGGVYEALERLERRGYLRSAQGESHPDRGGRPTRVFTVTAGGRRAMAETARVVAMLRASDAPAGRTR